MTRFVQLEAAVRREHRNTMQPGCVHSDGYEETDRGVGGERHTTVYKSEVGQGKGNAEDDWWGPEVWGEEAACG